MTILIVDQDHYAPVGVETPQVGRTYLLEDADSGTNAQNRAFHALVTEYYKSGLWSYQIKTFDDFRNCIKKSLGAGFEAFVYATIENGKVILKDTKKYEEIPLDIRKDPRLKEYVRGRLKSWSDYKKSERKSTIDNLLSEMNQVGVNSAKYQEICAGLGGLWT